MIKLINPEDITEIIRAEIIKQSELSGERVVNSLSMYGETLDKFLEKQIEDSYTLDDSFILFRVDSRLNNPDISFTTIDNEIIYIKSYIVKVIIYGDSSDILANKLVARLRSAVTKDYLINKGIYIEEVTNPDCVDEFKNGVLWPRNDFDISITSEFLIKPLEKENNYEKLTDLKIISK